jgi:hypothetical protein
MQRNARQALALPEGNGMPWLYKEMVVDHVGYSGNVARNGTECRAARDREKEKENES